jgi:hypothetical protein
LGAATISLQLRKFIAAQSSEIQLQPRAAVRETSSLPHAASGGGLVLPAGPRLPSAPPPKEGDAVKVTLHDCLACSGCVTTAETMLLEQQSVQQLRAALRCPDTHVIVSVAPQSLAALAGERSSKTGFH